MIARAKASPVLSRVQWPLRSVFGDLRVQYGTKVGLAGLLALFCALLLRLEHPNWSTEALTSDMRGLPETTKSVLRPEFEQLEAEFNKMLDAFVKCLRTRECRRPFPNFRDALARLGAGLDRIRQGGMLANVNLEVLTQLMELANRYQSTAEALEQCSSIMRTLKLERYMGDYAL